MFVWMTRIGWFAMALGALLWTRLADLLPIDLWLQLRHFFRPEHIYLRATRTPDASADPISVTGVLLVVLGLFLVAGTRWMRHRS